MELREVAAKIREIAPQGLSAGLGRPEPGKMCIEALVCSLLGEPHGDHPSCVNKTVRQAKIGLNDDAGWSSNQARGEGLWRAGVAQLGSAGPEFDEKVFIETYALLTIQRVLPVALRAAGLEEHAVACEGAKTLASARAAARAAWAAVRAAADAAAGAAADAWAWAAADAAAWAAWAARAAADAAWAARAADAAWAAADAAWAARAAADAAWAARAAADDARAADDAASAAWAAADAVWPAGAAWAAVRAAGASGAAAWPARDEALRLGCDVLVEALRAGGSPGCAFLEEEVAGAPV